MDSVTNSRSPPKSDKSFWILLVSVIVIVIILIVVLTMCNKPCKCKDKSCKGTCVPDETPCNLDKDCTFFGERCVGPSTQNYTPPGNCMLSKAQCKNDGECLNNMYCADTSDEKNIKPIIPGPGKQGVCYPKTLCKYEAQQAADPCLVYKTECNVDVGSSLSGIAPATATATGSGTWTLKGATSYSKQANGTYGVSTDGKQVTFVVSNGGSGLFPNDLASPKTTPFYPPLFIMNSNDPNVSIPTFSAPLAFTLSPPSQNARGYCSPAQASAQLNSQSHTLRGASHSSY